MNRQWPVIPLGDVLHRVERFEKKDPLKEYHFAGTYSFGRGIFSGERKLGSEFNLEKIQRIVEGDFVYCKIMAWEGAFGLVPKEADNCVMSGAFAVYSPINDKIEPKFLDYYFKIKKIWQSIGSQSIGTNVRRRSLHPLQFEQSIIPLPPLPEQQRIVAKIEALAARLPRPDPSA
jgi:type I restriction enzyme S subunit